MSEVDLLEGLLREDASMWAAVDGVVNPRYQVAQSGCSRFMYACHALLIARNCATRLP